MCIFSWMNGQINHFNWLVRTTRPDDNIITLIKLKPRAFKLFFIRPFSVFSRALLNQPLNLTFRIVKLFSDVLLDLLPAFLETVVRERHVRGFVEFSTVEMKLWVF
jgi:hypothetical protein